MKLPDIDCPPYAPVLMESTRAVGYSIESAVADIIDNSIAANAKQVDIYFNTNPFPYVAILDDGKGMSSDVLTTSMRYGSCSPSQERADTDLGRYGLGMKMASLSQCRSLSVISKQLENIEGRRWDLDHILTTQKWSLEQLDKEEIDELPCITELKKYETGTVVIWKSLDKVKLGGYTLEESIEGQMERVREHLELVFHRYLSGDGVSKVTIRMNGLKLNPYDPFMVGRSEVPMDDEKIDIPGRTGKVVVRPYVLPHPSNMSKSELDKYGGKDGFRSLQGFYIYRNKRLLTWGTWFGLTRKDEFTKLARVQVDIPNSLDDLWTLDIKKSTAYPPEIVKTRLRQLIGIMSSGSKRVWTFRQKKETKTNIVHIWDKVETREGVKYVVNQEHPILEELLERLDSPEKKLLMEYLDTVQNNLPFNNLHHDMHSDVKILYDKEDDEKQRVLSMAKELLCSANQGGFLEDTLKGLEITEPFCDYIEDIEKIASEVKING